MKELNMENANDHPFKVSIVKDAEFFANSHPYKVSIEGGGGGGNEGRVVDELPEEGEPGYIYLVLKEHSPEGDIYDEYMWVLLQDGETHGWEHIGATNEIKTGGATILTTADYNWNSVNKSTSGTLDSFALWLLDDGLYAFESGTPLSKVKTDKMNNIPGGEATSTKQASTILVLSSEDVWNRPVKTFIGSASMGGNPPGVNAFFVMGTGTDGTALYNNGGEMGQYGLTRGDIVNNLNSYDGSLPLSAAQGKILNDKIGQARLLTTADYNWNSTSHSAVAPYDSVALWLLEPGMYIFSSGTNGYIGYRNNTWYSTTVKKLYQVTPQGTYSKMVFAWEENHSSYSSPMDIGIVYGVLPSSGSIVHSCSLGAPIADISAPQIGSRTNVALAASVGYNLSQKIGDLTTLTTMAKTSTVAAINELATTIGNIQTILNIVNNGNGN